MQHLPKETCCYSQTNTSRRKSSKMHKEQMCYIAYHIAKVKVLSTHAHSRVGNHVSHYEYSHWPWQLENVSMKSGAFSWQLGHISMPCRLEHRLYKFIVPWKNIVCSSNTNNLWSYSCFINFAFYQRLFLRIMGDFLLNYGVDIGE